MIARRVTSRCLASTRLAARVAARALMLTLSLACQDAGPDAASASRPKLAIFGIDGATFGVIDPLLAQGRLPHLAALIEAGTRMPLLSNEDDGSPVLWATILTGVSKQRHGILGFSRRQGEQMVTYRSSDRRAPALWNMVSTRGGTVGVAGFLNTWPAEPVSGWLVSDRFQASKRATRGAYGDGSAVTWPEPLMHELAHLWRDPDALTREELLPWARFSDAEWQMLLTRDHEARPVRGNGFVNLKFAWAATHSVAQVTEHLLATREQPDLVLAYLELPDRVGHSFWPFWQPDAVRDRASLDHDRVERFGGLVPGSYEVVDALIGRMLAQLDPDTTVFVVSDHGMRSGGGSGYDADEPLNVGRGAQHDRQGVLIASGPAIRPGAVAAAELLDIAPTVLAALGLPGSRQTEGRVLDELLAPGFVARHPQGPALLEPPLRRRELALPEGVDDAYLRQFQAMGYIGGDGQELDWQGAQHAAKEGASHDGREGSQRGAGGSTQHGPDGSAGHDHDEGTRDQR
ncbi:MAG: hypothetical protein DRQ55_03310 [Planctomycetota bacterium]|nr:MAG: hypothetical protein DRQ55_03310 [Planctomycetota bacterium]